MHAEPRPQGAEYLNEVYAQLLCVQRSYRDRIIRELSGSVCQGLSDSYLLECQELPFSPPIFREVCLRLAPLLSEHCPQADFVPLLSQLNDVTLEKLAVELQHAPEQDLPKALHLAVQEVRLHKLSSLDHEALHSLLLAAFVPFFSAYAKSLDLDTDGWQHGWCPVCGQYPINGFNRSGDGRRILGCWMCETQWSFARLVCPVCSSQRQDGQLVLTPLGENRTRRIQVCKDCGHYLKITDCTQAESDCDLQEENAATVFLDILAQRKGYRPASDPQMLKQ